MKIIKFLVSTVVLLFTGLIIYAGNIKIYDDIELIEISEGFYIHKALYAFPGTNAKFPSNGIIVIKNGKALMIDTPVTLEQTEIICNYLKDSMNVEVEFFIGGHSHSDCIGGMNYFKNSSTKTILNVRTKNICLEKGLPLPDITYDSLYIIDFHGIKAECHYFGAGHTVDNTVVFFPESKILFGDCLIKSLDSQNLGNLQEAVVCEWIPTIEKIISTLGPIKYVIPGHGDYGSDELLKHTIKLVEQFK
ncbi:MAG: subclass B1 metallo-beta-lactamase [Prolixibacteraceae bacterium]|nr:subclass B1 metallo-beta-lactamase [Prolixibacteraceae bacterium]